MLDPADPYPEGEWAAEVLADAYVDLLITHSLGRPPRIHSDVMDVLRRVMPASELLS